MNRERLVRDIVRKSWSPPKDAEEAVDAVVKGILYGLRHGKSVPLPGVGRFHTRRAPKNRGRSQRVVVFTRLRKPAKRRG